MKTKNSTATKRGMTNAGVSNSRSATSTSKSGNAKSPGSRSAQGSPRSNGQNRARSAATPVDVAGGLRGLFEDQLKDIYWAEKALVKALPKMIKKASSAELKSTMQEHLDVTVQQVTRLEQVFESMGKLPRAKKCEAMEGLIKESESIMQETEAGMVRDAGIIAAAQKVEHYEIATYGTLCSFARTLNEVEAADLLEDTLNEEKDADEALTAVAESSINLEAAGAEEEEEEEEEDEEEEEEEE